ncbi:MAG: signal recognition particle-docking protein FtsY [Acidimicrobiia bacterium]
MDPIYIVIAVVIVLIAAGTYFFRSDRTVERSRPLPGQSQGIGGRISKSRGALGESLRAVFGRGDLDAKFWEQMEEALIGSDVGVAAAAGVVERVRRSKPVEAEGARKLLEEELKSVFAGPDRRLHLEGDPAVVLIVGVNGSGKTTSIAKLAARLMGEGRTPLLAAADTFRAAADTQLRAWAERVGVPVVAGKAGADPAAVAFDGLAAAKARGQDVVIVDTAGRLHNKQNLMAELAKIRRVLERDGGTVGESLLVLDATAGQNGIAQVREFASAIGLTGIILTKLDGTAKGGIVVAVEQELGVPVKLVGVGEAVDDLMPFDPDAFVAELLADA